MIPELRDLHPYLPAPTAGEPDETRAHLFEALSQLILGLAAGSTAAPEGHPTHSVASAPPVLPCLDDLQLDGDAPGAEAVADRLQRATGGNPFFLVETLRALIEDEVISHQSPVAGL